MAGRTEANTELTILKSQLLQDPRQRCKASGLQADELADPKVQPSPRETGVPFRKIAPLQKYRQENITIELSGNRADGAPTHRLAWS